jgi:hypothetical protein
MGDAVCFSGASLAIVGGLMSALTATIVALWKITERLHDQHLAAKDALIAAEINRHAAERLEMKAREDEWKSTALRWEELYRGQQTVTKQAIGLVPTP